MSWMSTGIRALHSSRQGGHGVQSGAAMRQGQLPETLRPSVLPSAFPGPRHCCLDDNLLIALTQNRSVDIKWATLSRRLRRERIVGLLYDSGLGYMVLELEGAELWLSADADGYHVFMDEGAAQGGISRDAVEDL